MASRAQGLILPGSERTIARWVAPHPVGADAAGALYWNPAVISGLPGSDVVIGSEVIIGDTHLGSTVPAGAFGILAPPRPNRDIRGATAA